MKKTIVLLMMMTVISGVALTACGSAADTADQAQVEQDANQEESAQVPNTTTQTVETSSAQVSEPKVSVKYVDGAYSAQGPYTSPAGAENISVNVTVKDDVITAVTVGGDSATPASKDFIGKFISGVNDKVVGKKLDEVGVLSAVNGASLTAGGFNTALAAIKAQAKN